MVDIYTGPERREFIRLDYSSPLAYKVCKPETIHKLLQGYTMNVSQTGLLCTIENEVANGDILWLSFDRSTLILCEEMDRSCLIYQSGIIGKVVRVEPKDDSYAVGIKFLDREEKNIPHVYAKNYSPESQNEQNDK
jgi:hypothetical protein